MDQSEVTAFLTVAKSKFKPLPTIPGAPPGPPPPNRYRNVTPQGAQQTALHYLPPGAAHNDFIFAVIAEELGLVGAVAVFGLLIVIVLRMFRIGRLALERNRAFEAYLAYGAGLLIGLQSLINVGVSTGALPTKGLTLPFVSYGGNSLLVCCALAGLSYRVSVELNAEARR